MKRLFVYSTLTAVMIAMSGCGQAEKTSTEKPIDHPKTEAHAATVVTAEGTYVGLADTHTVELKFNDGTKAFQFPETMKNQFDGAVEGTKVSVKYIENSSGQNELKTFTILKSPATEKSGEFVGLADTHTVELKFPEGAQAFQINEDLRSRFESLPEGAFITIQYEDNVITNFKLQEKVNEETGVYVGQADTHTVEIETANGAQSYQLSESASEDIKPLKENDSVNFQYVKNEYGQLILKSIHKK